MSQVTATSTTTVWFTRTTALHACSNSTHRQHTQSPSWLSPLFATLRSSPSTPSSAIQRRRGCRSFPTSQS
ncbi:hypothetical protein CesoFtcFv8_002451 [Champsocephalus esox]|uniref:Uncharacterized protein n=1 Tax=Champsocephalus esox TaxID=159716 RepID=A0AAN8D1H5_9TELE|nr:hypothetical protein CesoFtcFv8_002451 [Champsocephalus esox]